MQAAQLDFVINQGATFNDFVTVTDENDVPIDYTGYTGSMQVRLTKADSNVLLECSTVNGRLTLGADGVIAFNVPFGITALLDFDRAVYDLFVYAPAAGPAEKVLEGTVILDKAVTR